MNKITIMVVTAIIVVLGAGYAVARPESSGMMGGNGMMGSDGNRVTGGLSSMMGQYAGMMSDFGSGIWNSMMGYGNGATAGYGGMMGGNG
ncbi:MAG TPA: hypothetical protein VKL21_01340, partial [Candidatus Methanoperedens sp.]|nr:hypothetical protein [Candidatus Methanoperedens sp.]